MARRLRLALHHFAPLAQQFIAFGHHRQRRAVVLFIALFAAKQRPPARLGQKTRFGDKLTVGDLEVNLAFTEHRVRAELHQILAGDQGVDLRFVIGEFDLAAAGGRDNRMVRVDLFIIPAAVADLRIHHRLRQQIRRMDGNRIQHRMAAGEMFFRQVAAVRTRIGDELVGFIQLLADIQHVLRAEAETFGRLNLQRRQRKRQRRGFGIALIVIACHQRRLAFNTLNHVLGQRTMQQAPFFILVRFAGFARHPGRDKALLLRRDDMRFDIEEVFGDEVFNLFIAAHHQAEHRGLHPPHGEHPLIAGVAPQQGIGPGHIDAVQPVGARPRQRRHAKRHKLAVSAQAVDRPLNRLRVEIVYQTALHLLTLLRRQLQVVEHLIHQQLPLTVGVAGVDNLLGLAEQALDDIQLFGDRRFWLQLPFLRHNWQIGEIPAGIAAVIDVRLRLLQQVTDTPGDHLPVAALNKAIAFAMRFRQHIGDSPTETRFFCNKQPHRINGSRSWVVRRGRSPARRWRPA